MWTWFGVWLPVPDLGSEKLATMHNNYNREIIAMLYDLRWTQLGIMVMKQNSRIAQRLNIAAILSGIAIGGLTFGFMGLYYVIMCNHLTT